MIRKDLSKEAISIWNEYGALIVSKFGFAKRSIIDQTALENAIQSGDEKSIKDFIDYTHQQIEMLKKVK